MFEQQLHLIDLLYDLANQSEDPFELPERIIYEGNYFDGLVDLIHDVFDCIAHLKLHDNLLIKFDEVVLDDATLRDDYLEKNEQPNTWRIDFDKIPIYDLFRETLGDTNFLLFIQKNKFYDWISKISPFSIDNPISSHLPLKIFVHELPFKVSGPQLIVSPLKELESVEFSKGFYNLPSESKIRTQVHVASSEITINDPIAFYLDNGDLTHQEAKPLLNISFQALAICLIQEFYSTERIILKGMKRLELTFTAEALNEIEVSPDCLKKVKEVVEWVYEERTETRSKLLSERLTLDLPPDKPFTSSLCEFIDEAFSQSKDQYGFVILERKDQYVKELANLITDVRKQSDLLATKIRAVLNNLLKDVLATLFILGFSIFGKISLKLEENNFDILEIIFKGLAIYLTVSYALQILIHGADIWISKRELNHWLYLSRNYLSKKEIRENITKPLRPRIVSLIVFTLLITAIYCILIYYSWNFIAFLKYFSASINI